MLKQIILLFFMFLMYNSTYSQDATKSWNEGKLTWNDFKAKSGEPNSTQLSYFLGYEEDDEEYGDTSVTRNLAKAYIDRYRSWADPNLKTEQYLRYNQVIYDIIEVYRRSLQFKFDHVANSDACEYILRSYSGELNEELQQYKQESNSGANLDIIEKWERKIADSLSANIYRLPEIRESQFAYYGSLGLSTGFLSGSLSDKISPSFAFSVGSGCVYDDYTLAFWLINHHSWSESSDIPTESKQVKKMTEIFISTVYLSYNVYKRKEVKIAPLLGLGIIESNGATTQRDYTPVLGISMDYRYGTSINLANEDFLFSRKSKNDYDITAKLFITHTSLSPERKGFSINLTLSWALTAGFIDVL